MLLCAKTNTLHFLQLQRLIRLLGLVCVLWGGLAASAQPEGGFQILSAHTRLDGNLYRLNAQILYGLSAESREALVNGVALTLVLNIEVERGRWYLWDERIARLNQRYQLKYHPLSGQYMLTYLNTGIQENYSHLNSVLARIGNLMDFPLLDRQLIRADQQYRVNLKTYLDIEALPAPLRPVAYFSTQWRLTSNLYTCPLEPSVSF